MKVVVRWLFCSFSLVFGLAIAGCGTTIGYATGLSVAPPTVSLSASPPSITAGTAATLTVTASEASTVTIAGSDGSSYNLSASGGAQAVSPAATTTYTATATGSGGTATATAMVTVTPPPPPTITISAGPASITVGSSSTLTVVAANASDVTVTGSDGSSYSLDPTGGQQVVQPPFSTTYTSVADGDGGQASATATVTVNPPAPVAFLYLAVSSDHSAPAIIGYAVAPNGVLTPVPGSPFPENGGLAATGKYLVAMNLDDVHLDTLQIGADGSLNKVQSFDETSVGSNCTPPDIYQFVTDRTGANLYGAYNDCDQALAFQSFTIDRTTGALGYLSSLETRFGPYLEAFSGNDLYVYGGMDPDGEGCGWIADYTRASDGALLSQYDPAPNLSTPAAPEGICYAPRVVAADDSNYLVADLTPYALNTELPNGQPDQLANYTIASDGSVSSTNTSANMPQVAVTMVAAMRMSPSNKLVAVGGLNGIQIFNFNGASPLTSATGLVPTDSVVQMEWDNNNHLFVLSATGSLYVFTVTPAGVVQDAGSPYATGAADRFTVAFP